MTHEQWQKVKEECHNEKMVAFAGLSVEAQKAMREACESMGAPVDWVDCDGSWEPVNMPTFYKGNAYRINLSWSGHPVLSCGDGFRWVEKGEALLDGDQFFSPRKEEWSPVCATVNAKCLMNYTYRRPLTPSDAPKKGSWSMKLSENEHILCAYARTAEGPGWVNYPVWVIIENTCTMQIRQECLQPSDQTDLMRQMYDVFSSVDRTMYSEVIKLLKKEKS